MCISAYVVCVRVSVCLCDVCVCVSVYISLRVWCVCMCLCICVCGVCTCVCVSIPSGLLGPSRWGWGDVSAADACPLGHCVHDTDAPGRRRSIGGWRREPQVQREPWADSRRAQRACEVSPTEQALRVPAGSLPQQKAAYAGPFRALGTSNLTIFRSLESKRSVPSRLS